MGPLLTGEKALLLGALLCYAAGAAQGLVYLFAERKPGTRWEMALVAMGFVLQSVFSAWRWVRLGAIPLTGSRAESLLLLIWCITLLHLILRLTRKSEGASAFAMPVVVALFGAVFLSLDQTHDTVFDDPWVSGHIATAMLAYGAFAVAGAFGLMHRVQVRQLRSRRLTRLMLRLPPLEALERTLDRLLWIGVPLLTCALVIGAIGVVATRDLPTSRWLLDPKVLTSLVMWTFYAGVTLGRWRRRISGELLAILAIAGFCLVVTTYLLAGALLGGAHPFR